MNEPAKGYWIETDEKGAVYYCHKSKSGGKKKTVRQKLKRTDKPNEFVIVLSFK